jgi:hypothetical protein
MRQVHAVSTIYGLIKGDTIFAPLQGKGKTTGLLAEQ